METLAWTCALGGFVLGGALSVVPGFPGCSVSLLGLVAFAGLTDFRTVPPEALGLAAFLTLLGALAQLAAPALTSRSVGGAAGVATGAALGGAVGSFVPMPGVAWLLAVVGGAVLGLAGWRDGLGRWLRGVVGAGLGCVTGAALDLMATLGIGAVLGLADFLSVWATAR